MNSSGSRCFTVGGARLKVPALEMPELEVSAQKFLEVKSLPTVSSLMFIPQVTEVTKVTKVSKVMTPKLPISV